MLGPGFYIGAFVGFLVALLVAFGLVHLLDIQSPWTILVGFGSGMVFTNLGMAIGGALDD